MNEEIILDKLRKMLFTIQQANECGLSNNDFKEDIQILSGAIGLIENLIQRNKDLKQIEKEHNYTANEDCIPISKLKENIKELGKQEKAELKGMKGQDRYSIKLEYMHKRNALQELLEESEK